MIITCTCGKVPEKVTGWKDRDLHPDTPWMRYSCRNNLDGHLVVGPTAHADYLGWDLETPELKQKAERLWNEFISGEKPKTTLFG
jgi:hypothetical protein